MNDILIKILYNKSIKHLNSNEAWTFEKAFAQEIVRECALIASHEYTGADAYFTILERFGLE